jgi:saccharopepsin
MSQITEISVGTPPQKIRVIISISDNDLFIPSYKWDEDSPGRHWIYNSSLSSSFNATNSETFSGYFRLGGSSDISKETVHIAGMTLKEQSFDEGVNFYYRTDIFSSDEGWDGYLGLAPSKNGSISGIPSIYQSMVSRGLLDRNIFSLKLSRGLEDPGEIMFGGINHDLYTGPLKSIPLVPDNEKMERVKGRWNVPLTSITLGDGSVELEDYVATLESDFPLIGLQDEYVKLLNNYMGTETKINFGAPSIDCRKRDQLENLTIRLGEHDFVIGPYEYTWEVYLQEWKGLRCVSAFVGMDLVTHENYVLLGSAFLRNFYGVFDSEGGTVSLGNAVAREKTR